MPPKTVASREAETLYLAYPKHVGRGAALKAIGKALGKERFDVLLEAVQAYAAARRNQDAQFTPHASTWFAQERWADDRACWVNGSAAAHSLANADYEAMCLEVRRVGAQQVPVYPNWESRNAVKAMGGWAAFCIWPLADIERRRKRFLENYR